MDRRVTGFGGTVRLLDPAEAAPGVPPPSPGPDRDLVALVEQAGLVGRGGGGFPTARKMAAVAGRRRPVLVANGAEGEPLSHKDEVLLGTAPHLVLAGIALAARAVGARQAELCLHRGSPALPAVRAALASHHGAGVRIGLRQTPRRYVASEESALIRWLSGGPAMPTSRPPLPAERGVRGAPTLVLNVETLADVALVARRGAAWYRSVGDPSEPGTLLVTVAGAVPAPGVVEVPTGVALGEVLGLAGATPESVGAVLAGGFGGGWLSGESAWRTPLTYAGLRSAGAALGPGLLAVLPPWACGVTQTSSIARYLAGQSAGQCGPCVFGLPGIAGALEAVGRGDRHAPAAAAAAGRWSASVAGRGACRHPDGTARMVTSALRVFAGDFARHARGIPCAASRSAPVLGVPGPSEEDWR
ncbi:MAG TPA: NADH-ubiquinone oxidoreductase-F iron-sulfur binding region domain-containing protein [Mycobacteriales bacterium]|nr:NADH-ubiquinone oxidoreductase-F iron-sulfur binding region domain-containing protein [Mycobacteriales bacterium]